MNYSLLPRAIGLKKFRGFSHLELTQMKEHTIGHGAYYNTMDHTGLTSFLEAATKEHEQVCEVLSQHLHGPGQCLKDVVALHQSWQEKFLSEKNAPELMPGRSAEFMPISLTSISLPIG